jgi:myo-inositol 2-dehydrogenase/D-chiro-inositol 1-dehydrogenase
VNKVKVGIIGCGWFGNFHLDNLLKMDNVHVVALASTNKIKLDNTGKKVPSANLYNSYIDMFNNEIGLEAVFICVPPYSHENIELLAAEKGIHIYVEKPIELSMQKALEVERAINTSGIIASVGYHERYSEAIENIRNYILSRETGLVTGRWLGGIPGAPWWRIKERSGGQLVEQCTHIFDLLRFFFGEAESVYSTAVKGIVKDMPNYNIEDASSTIVSFKNGVSASVLTGCYFDDGVIKDGAGIQIFCRDSVIEYDWMNEVRYISNGMVEKASASDNSHFKAASAFIEAIQTKNMKLIKSTYSDSVKTLALTLAANESMISKLPVKL